MFYSLHTLKEVPKGVWILGCVSMLMDISSEMIHSLLPVFMVGSLGMSVALVGLLEGLAESLALIIKVFSGVISDAVGRRKGLALLGYSLGALSKPLFAIAPTMGWIVAGRLIDRVGKGIRGAPRDALVADITPPEVRGAAFGLRQSLDTVGAFTGPLIAVGLMLLWQNDFRAVFWVAVLPAVLAVIVLACGVREPKNSIALDRRMNPISIVNLKRLSLNYWAVVMFGAVFTLARFSEAFLVLRAQQLGVALAWVPLVMVAMNAVYALSAYPFGYLSDKVSHRALLAGGLLVLIAADFCLANAVDWKVLMCGVMLWGFHMGMTQGLLARMVVDASPADLRGTAFGFFNLMTGIAMLIASVLAGYVWDGLGAAYTFYVGAGISALALVGLSALNFQAKNL